MAIGTLRSHVLDILVSICGTPSWTTKHIRLRDVMFALSYFNCLHTHSFRRMLPIHMHPASNNCSQVLFFPRKICKRFAYGILSLWLLARILELKKFPLKCPAPYSPFLEQLASLLRAARVRFMC